MIKPRDLIKAGIGLILIGFAIPIIAIIMIVIFALISSR